MLAHNTFCTGRIGVLAGSEVTQQLILAETSGVESGSISVYSYPVDSLWPNYTIWQQTSGSAMAQVMTCCLTAPSHYLNQCWIIKLSHPSLGWLYVFSSFLPHPPPRPPLQQLLPLMSKPFQLNLRYLAQRIYKTASFQKEAMRTQVALYFFYEVKFV